MGADKDFDDIIKEQDVKQTLSRVMREVIVKLYPDKTHFIYELLQNAEDAKATCINFHQFNDRLEVLHDGLPFTKSNAKSFCDAALSDKVEEKIGKFGIGFKSVYTICDIIEFYNEPSNRQTDNSMEKFGRRIENFMTPIKITNDFKIEKPYTTKFVFPFFYGKNASYDNIEELRLQLSKKISNLGTNVLLFLKNIKEINYTIEGFNNFLKKSDKYFLQRENITANVKTNVSVKKVKDNNGNFYMLFSKKNTSNNISVGIAFSIEEDFSIDDKEIKFICSNISKIFVFFPTETESKVNFIVQAPFELDPSRSNLLRDSIKNIELINILSELLKEAVFYIKHKKWLTLEFIKLLPYNFLGNKDDWSLYKLHATFLDLLNTEAIIPTNDGDYIHKRNAVIARGEKLLKLFNDDKLCDLLNRPNVKWLSAEFTKDNYGSLHEFFTSGNGLAIYEIRGYKLPGIIRSNPSFLKKQDNQWLIYFYNYLSKLKEENLFGKNGGLATTPFIKCIDGEFYAPYKNITNGQLEKNIFLRPKNNNSLLSDFHYIDEYIAENCIEFLNVLELSEPDNAKQFIKQLENINEKDYFNNTELCIRQIKQVLEILKFNSNDNNIYEINRLLLVNVLDFNNNVKYFRCTDAIIYREKDYNNVSIKDYIQNIFNSSISIHILNEEFYKKHNISEEDLQYINKLNIKNNIYKKENTGLYPEYLTQVFDYIKDERNDINKRFVKSGIVFSLLKNIENDIKDIVILHKIRNEKWLFNNKKEIKKPSDISRYDLDVDIYGKVDETFIIYDLLEFKKTENEKQINLVREVNSYLHSKYSFEEIKLIIRGLLPEDDEDDIFDPTVNVLQEECPKGPIIDLDRIKLKIKNEYKFAKEPRYEEKLRRIRTSRNYDKQFIRDYYNGYCQMCGIKSFWEIAEIFNEPKKEMSQMNLSLCPHCACEYRRLRNDKNLMTDFKNKIIENDPEKNNIIVISEKSLRFRNDHLAEVQEILRIEKDYDR